MDTSIRTITDNDIVIPLFEISVLWARDTQNKMYINVLCKQVGNNNKKFRQVCLTEKVLTIFVRDYKKI